MAFSQIIKRSYADVARSYAQDVTNSMASWTETFGRIYRPIDDGEYFSLAGWKSRAQEVRRLILEHKDSSDKHKAALAEIYAGDALKKATANIDNEHSEMIAKARDLIGRDFRFVMGEKKLAHGMALFAPSETQLRLLQTLSMRSNLEREEIDAAAIVCGDNLQALRTLADICKNHDIYFPALPSESDYSRAVEAMEEVGKIAVDDCALSDDRLGYHGRVFWETDGWGLNSPAAEQLDRPVYLKIDNGDEQPKAQDGHIRVTNGAAGY